MPKFNATRFINHYSKEENAGVLTADRGFDHLRAYLGRVKQGQPEIYEAPFAIGVSMSQILDEWRNVLESVKRDWPSLWDFEEDLASKVGPLSVEKPLSERLEDIAHYYEDIQLSSTPIDNEAVAATVNEFAAASGLRLRNLQNTVAKMKKSTNSGLPYFVKRRTVVEKTMPCTSLAMQGDFPSVKGKLRSSTTNLAAVVGWRGQEGGPQKEDVKQRVVWMFPFSVNINELQVYQPLIESFQRLEFNPAWVSMDSVDKRITRLFDSKSSKDLVICTDFSKFDQHFNKDMQTCAERILRSLLSPGSQSNSWLEEVFPIKYLIPLAWNTTIANGYRTISTFVGYHGMASGSGGTNADESLTHRALQHEAAIRNGKKLNLYSQCNGDDGVLTFPGISVDKIVKTYESHGQECNPDKQYVSTNNCVYLRRWHQYDYRIDGVCAGVYSTNRALGRLKYTERYLDETWDEKDIVLRELSIIENCNKHPLKESFADFCLKRSKYHLGRDIPGFYDNIDRYGHEAIEKGHDVLGYTKSQMKQSKISEWWIVKYLKSKR